jgi:hypothetical protein
MTIYNTERNIIIGLTLKTEENKEREVRGIQKLNLHKTQERSFLFAQAFRSIFIHSSAVVVASLVSCVHQQSSQSRTKQG